MGATENAVNRYNRYLTLLGIGGSVLYDFSEKERTNSQYITYMLDKTVRMFEYGNLPPTIPAYILEQMLQCYGFVGIAKHKGELYAYYGGLGGEPDVYYRPTVLTVANPAQRLSETWEIGKDVALIYNDSLMLGMLPLYNQYATLLTENNISMRMAIINSRMQKLLVAPDDETYKGMREYMRKLIAGDLDVIMDNAMIAESKALIAGEGADYIEKIQSNLQYLKASWYNEIGLDANWNTKSSQLYSAEAQMNRGALMALTDAMLKEREEGLERVNELFGTDISVHLSDLWQHDHNNTMLSSVGANLEPTPGSNPPTVDIDGGTPTDGTIPPTVEPLPPSGQPPETYGDTAGTGEPQSPPAVEITVSIEPAETVAIDGEPAIAETDNEPYGEEEEKPDEND